MNKKIKVSLLIASLAFVALPINTSAKTVKEFEDEVASYTKKLQEKKDKIAKNDAEVAQIKQKIIRIEGQIVTATQQIAQIEREIEASNKKIEAKEEESKKLMKYFQVVVNDNAYLEYIFGATTIKDMIYRMSVVEQLTEYNSKIMKELEALIKENNRKEAELKNKKTELNGLKKSLQSERERINADSAAIRETMPSLEQQIKAARENAQYYKKLGCGKTEDIQACQYRIEQSKNSSNSLPSVNGFYRPMHNGYVTQGYHGFGGHLGIDLSASNKAIEIYPIASGQVFYNGRDSAGALVVKIRHNVGGRYIYSTYAHMRQVYSNVKKGTYISWNTPIGKMGSTGFSTGPHLHLELTTCDWNKGGGCTWRQYQRSTINPSKYIVFPRRWNNR